MNKQNTLSGCCFRLQQDLYSVTCNAGTHDVWCQKLEVISSVGSLFPVSVRQSVSLRWDAEWVMWERQIEITGDLWLAHPQPDGVCIIDAHLAICHIMSWFPCAPRIWSSPSRNEKHKQRDLRDLQRKSTSYTNEHVFVPRQVWLVSLWCSPEQGGGGWILRCGFCGGNWTNSSYCITGGAADAQKGTVSLCVTLLCFYCLHTIPCCCVVRLSVDSEEFNNETRCTQQVVKIQVSYGLYIKQDNDSSTWSCAASAHWTHSICLIICTESSPQHSDSIIPRARPWQQSVCVGVCGLIVKTHQPLLTGQRTMTHVMLTAFRLHTHLQYHLVTDKRGFLPA